MIQFGSATPPGPSGHESQGHSVQEASDAQGASSGVDSAVLRAVQSARDRGEKILVPLGQLFVCEDLCTSIAFTHLNKAVPSAYVGAAIISQWQSGAKRFS